MKLLSRTEFRQGVFARDNHMCVIPGCLNPAEDAHHIIERRLWPDGGYYLENGASLCDLNGEGHHRDAEDNLILPQELRDLCGITEIALPADWDDSLTYNKWGHVINWSGKYPRTYHLPSSLTKYGDDKVLGDLSLLKNSGDLIVTEKMDGENTTMTRERIHARSVDSAAHPSQSFVRNIWSKIRFELPDNFRICGENLYATHSVYYSDVPYFMVFNVWEDQTCLSWDDAVQICEILDLPVVPVLYRGPSFDDAIKAWNLDDEHSEGFVVRHAGEIPLRLWSRSAAKHVRANHVRTLDHGWRFRNDFRINNR